MEKNFYLVKTNLIGKSGTVFPMTNYFNGTIEQIKAFLANRPDNEDFSYERDENGNCIFTYETINMIDLEVFEY